MQITYVNEDIFDCVTKEPNSPDDPPAVCIMTNAIIKTNGCAVMGRGIAKRADDLFDVSRILAGSLKEHGNHVYHLGIHPYNGVRIRLLSFPTKYHWKDDSDLELITQSCRELKAMCDRNQIKTCYLVPPGCANGHLDWETQVKPEIVKILDDDRFIVVIRR